MIKSKLNREKIDREAELDPPNLDFRVDIYTAQELIDAMKKRGVTAMMFSELPKNLLPQNSYPKGRSIPYSEVLVVWDRLAETLRLTHGFELGKCSLKATDRVQTVQYSISDKILLASLVGTLAAAVPVYRNMIVSSLEHKNPHIQPSPIPGGHQSAQQIQQCEGVDLGSSCSVFVEGCKLDGVKICEDGVAVCFSTPRMRKGEVCDWMDNSCDGIVDPVAGAPLNQSCSGSH